MYEIFLIEFLKRDKVEIYGVMMSVMMSVVTDILKKPADSDCADFFDDWNFFDL
jgi:hypothetical protein